ncbi:hypothetical protein ACGFWI_37025 [Streptomyces sp. NPDC048434]|uniref:hypothetical protein n=1 Tax=Streptomyces sp. NPDC048434 TaxID=3365549 RepID=UPI00371C016B
MRQDEFWDVAAAQGYETPSTGMFVPEILEPTSDRRAELAHGGGALKFAVGTGRVLSRSHSEECGPPASRCRRPMIDLTVVRVRGPNSACP